MLQKSSRRLAGCIVIELFAAAALSGGDLEFKAGAAASGRALALVLEDRRGNRTAIAQADFPVTRSLSDFVCARLLESYDLDRAGVLLRGAGRGEASPDDLLIAIAGALGRLKPASVSFGDGTLSVAAADRSCMAALSHDALLTPNHCGTGELVRGPIRFAFRMFEPGHGLQHRGDATPVFALQVIGIGKQVTILGLPGEVPPDRFRSGNLMVVSFSNDNSRLPDSPEMAEAVRQLLQRVH
jgi:hypothetical protein